MKVAIYCRLSEEDRDKRNEENDSESIQNQKSMLIQYALDHGWDVCQIYSDDDYAGADRNRPAFNQLLADAEAKQFDIVLCKTQSRFTREIELVEKYLHYLFPIWGIRFVSTVDNADTSNRGNKKSRQINGLVNEWYIEDLSDNIKATLTNKRQRGLHIGAFALYGYQKDPEEKGHLIIDEEAAETVREVFTLFMQGYGKATIARLFNERSLPNPTEYKRLKNLRYKPPKTKNSTLWWYYTVDSMLKNEMYIGHMVQGKYASVSYKTKQNKPRPKAEWIRVENTHEPIIDLALWNKVQTLLKQRAKPWGTTGKVGIFSGKAKCINCGGGMRTCKNHGYHYLKCGIRHTAKEMCIGSFVSVRALEETVLSELRKLSDSSLDKDVLEKQVEFNTKLDDAITRKSDEIRTYSKRIDEHAIAIKDLYMDKVKGIISEGDFLSLSRDFSADKERLERLITEAQGEIQALEQKKSAGCNRRQLVEDHVGVEKLSKTHVDVLIDKVFIGKRDQETKMLPVEIHWNF